MGGDALVESGPADEVGDGVHVQGDIGSRAIGADTGEVEGILEDANVSDSGVEELDRDLLHRRSSPCYHSARRSWGSC